MADAWNELPGKNGDAYIRMCGVSGDAYSRLPGNTGDAWERLIVLCHSVYPGIKRCYNSAITILRIGDSNLWNS